MLYDRLRPLTDNPICPKCSDEMEFTSKERHEDGTFRVLKYECPTCHTRERITTRNNARVDAMWVIGSYGVLLGFVVGLAVEAFVILRSVIK